MAPAGIFITGFLALPLLFCGSLSLFRVDLLSGLPPSFVGGKNYLALFHDLRLGKSLVNTVVFTAASVGVETLLGLVFALWLSRQFLGRGICRTASLIPWILPTAVMATAWRWMFNDTFGVVNDVGRRLGLIQSPLVWLGDPALAMTAMVAADVWKTTPFMTLIVLAGLQSIPGELYEAAHVDGAGPWRRFWLVTWPGVRALLLVAVLFRAIQAFGMFDLVWVMTGGGPADATTTVSLYLYQKFLRDLDLGYASALTVVLAAGLMGGVWAFSRMRER